VHSLREARLIILATICLLSAIYVLADQQSPAKVELPDTFDWRDKGIMTPVKHQMECGSCGEFAAVAVLEALIKKETGVEVDLSEQQIVDCVPGCGCNSGCSSLQAMEYMRENGCALEEEFPYAGKDTKCRSGLTGKYRFNDVISTVIAKHPLSERLGMMKDAILKYGPIATNMGLYDDLGRYKSGVYEYDGKAASQGGHWVVVIGWTDDAELPSGGYWLCRNSWGEKWGDSGYFKSAYGDQTGIDDYYFVTGTYIPDSNAAE